MHEQQQLALDGEQAETFSNGDLTWNGIPEWDVGTQKPEEKLHAPPGAVNKAPSHLPSSSLSSAHPRPCQLGLGGAVGARKGGSWGLGNDAGVGAVQGGRGVRACIKINNNNNIKGS